MRISNLALSLCLGAATLAAAPQLRLSTNTIGPVYVEGGSNAQPQTINAFNLGDGALNLAVASTSAPWLSASVGAATTCSGGPVSPCVPVNIALNTAGLAIGTYTESIILTDPNAVDAPQIVTVTVQVNGAPTNVDFYVTPNNGASTAQSDTTFLRVNTGNAVISTVKTNDNGQWLSFVLFGGNQVLYTGYQLRVTSQTGQPEGVYTGMVILSGSTYPSDNKTINVTLHVTSQPIVQIPASPITFNLVQGQAPQTYNVTFQNFGLGNLSITGATSTTSSGGTWLQASSAGGTTAAITADPGSLAPGSYYGAVTLASNAANAAVPIPVRVNVSAPGNPIAAFGGVVDNAAFASGQPVAAGSIAAIFGTQLATSPAYASGFPLPTTLGGAQVLINGTAVPLFYADSSQIDFQVPTYLSTGQVLVQVVRNGQPGNRVSATVDSIAPRLFALRQLPAAPDGLPYGVALNSDGTLVLPSNLGVAARPAHRGDVITIYALGLGPVFPVINTGDPAPSNEPLARLNNQIQVVYGNGSGAIGATPSYAGLAPAYAGLYQINVLIPANAPTGNVPVSLSLAGHVSNVVELAISAQ